VSVHFRAISPLQRPFRAGQLLAIIQDDFRCTFAELKLHTGFLNLRRLLFHRCQEICDGGFQFLDLADAERTRDCTL
jgi:hypothetical protein